MYKKQKAEATSINVNKSYEGERIEEKIMRITNNKEPISDGAPIVYTERNEGVKPEYDIRTDRWEIATEAMDKVAQQKYKDRANRHMTEEEKLAKAAKEGMEKEKKSEGGPQPIPGTDGSGTSK